MCLDGDDYHATILKTTIAGKDVTLQIAEIYVDAFLALTADLGLVCKPEKTRLPNTEQPFAGITSSTDKKLGGAIGCSGYSTEKARRVVALLEKILNETPENGVITMATAAKLAGKLNDWAPWVESGRFHIAPMWKLMYPKTPLGATTEEEARAEEARDAQAASGTPGEEWGNPFSVDGEWKPRGEEKSDNEPRSDTNTGPEVTKQGEHRRLARKVAIATLGPEFKKNAGRNQFDPEQKLTMTLEYRDCLKWWIAHGEERNMVPTYLSGNPETKGVWRGQTAENTPEGHAYMDRHHATPGGDDVLTSDACTNSPVTNRPCMGAYHKDESYRIDVEDGEPDQHIGYWEYKIGHIVLTKLWTNIFKGKRLLWRIDNMIAVAAVRKGYSGLKEVDDLLAELGESLFQNKINLWAMHIPGKLNERADQISRHGLNPTTCVYVLKNKFFRAIDQALREEKGPVKRYTGHTLDGYADAQNTKCAAYCSETDPFEEKDLRGHDVWLSCNFARIHTALNHLIAQKATHGTDLQATIVVPHRPGETWAHRLQQHCTLLSTVPMGERAFMTKRVATSLHDDHSETAPLVQAGPTPWQLDVWRMH